LATEDNAHAPTSVGFLVYIGVEPRMDADERASDEDRAKKANNENEEWEDGIWKF